MHEMSYVIRLVNLALQNIADDEAVKKVVVRIGKMTGVEPYYMQKYYKTAIQGTQLEGSLLETVQVEVKAECSACKTVYTPDASFDYLCPQCGGGACRIIDGRDVTLEKIILEEDKNE